VNPYVCTIPLAIKANVSFPLALIAGMSGSLELDQRFYDGILRIAVNQAELGTKPIVRNQYAALISIGQNRRHFWCLRHLIEKFGSNLFLGEVARRLAFCSTWAQFENEVEACSLDLTLLTHKEKLTLEVAKERRGIGGI
jgi:hypothetical protein